MDTAGKDFFNKDFFDNHFVAIGEWPLDRLIWYGNMPEQEFEEYLKSNKIKSKKLKKKARNILTDFDSDFLQIPFFGENRVKHHYDKILWLIQEYCLHGWKNPLKAINLHDTGNLVIHPGTNRCAAARFLKCSKMPVMINIHKDQDLAKKVDGFKIITKEKDLRNSLQSKGQILWRTESTENLYIKGERQHKKTFQEFTFEFTHQDAWPKQDNLNKWANLVTKFLPLKIYVKYSNNYNEIIKNSESLKLATFHNRVNKKKSSLDYKIDYITEKLDYSKPWIKLDINKVDFNVFDLLFFLNPDFGTIKSENESIFINNPYGSKQTLIIPDHYVQS